MDEKAKGFLKKLLETPGVSGYEQNVQAVVADYASSFADSMEKDLHGNLILRKNEQADLRVLYAGHCDQIGMIISQIDESGFLY